MKGMKAACEELVIPYINFHQLRHTYASWSIMSGMRLIEVAEQLGHANTSMVEKHYGHLSAEHMTRAVEVHAPRLRLQSVTNVERLRSGGGTTV